jgi:transcriptional regulator with XRE-family HTH domain
MATILTTKFTSKTLDQLNGFVRKRSAQLNLPITELAERAGLTRAYLHALLGGKTRNPGVLTLARLAAALQIPSVSLYRLFEEAAFVAAGSADTLEDVARQGDTAKHWQHRQRHLAVDDMTDALVFTEDVTIPDHSMVLPGERFTKTWAVQNAGMVHWRSRRLERIDQELVVALRDGNGFRPLLDSHLHSLGRDVDVPDTPPGHGVELSVDFMAPRENCSVASLWRFVDVSGKPVYRHSCFLQVIVNVLGG